MSLTTTKADELAEELERAIVAGDLPPGTVLRQEQLCARYAISRTPVREALRQLAAQGLVSVTPNRGARVRSLSLEDLRDSLMIRAELEGLAAELAARDFPAARMAALIEAEQWFAALGERLTAARANGRDGDSAEMTAWDHANDAFHDEILLAARLPALVTMGRSVRRSSEGLARKLDADGLAAIHSRKVVQHRAIREAIAAGSPTAARALLRDHILDPLAPLDERTRVPAAA